MRKVVFAALRQRYGFACGYCGITETDAGALLTVDHFRPRAQGGSDATNNLVYACHACNEYKGDYYLPDGVERILHPLNDPLASHFALRNDGVLTFQTDTGRFHVNRLHLNRPPLVAYRLRALDYARSRAKDEQEQRERAELVALMRDVVKQITDLSAVIDALHSGGE